MSGSSEGTSQNPSETEKKPKSSRKGKIIGVWFAVAIWFMVLMFSPFRPFDEIWSLPRIFIFTNGQLDLPNTIFWIMGTIISCSLIYFGIGSVQSSTHQTNVINTPTDWMVKFIISFCWNSFHKDPSIQQEELFTQVSNKIPMISSLEGSVDVGKLFGAGSGGDALDAGKSTVVERVLIKIDRLSQRMDISGTILTPMELEDGKKGWMKINVEPKKSGERKEYGSTAVSTRMLLDPLDIPEITMLSADDRRTLGIEPPDDKKDKDKKNPPASGA